MISWLSLSAVVIWLVLAIQFHQRVLAEREKLDLSQLAGDDGSSTIFEGKGERAAMFAVAQRRLRVLEKWFIPIASTAIACYEIIVGILLLRGIPTILEFRQSPPFLLCAVCMTAIAFVNFLMSRYATGMSAEPTWKPLRAGGSFILGIAVLCFVLAVGLALANFQIFVVVRVLNYVSAILLVVLGSETALNVVLDIYRPRLKGQYSRSAFDSRLLGIINEPGGIFRSAASAMDYQFGFQVSQTWFYRLLERAILPLVLFAAVTLYLMSCVVVVAPNEEAIIEHLGNPRDSAGQVRLVGPGLAFKWPWPIDKARKFPTQRISELYIGYIPKTNPDTGEVIPETHLLWGAAHYEEEYPILVATEYTGRDISDGAVPVSLINAAVPVQYRVKDLYSYIYNYDDPETVLEAICYEELTRFAAGATIDVKDQGSGGAGREASLFGAGRLHAKKALTDNIQKCADAAKLGIEIVFLGLQGIHPPVDVAADYQAVAGAVQEKQKIILDAEAARNKNLSTLAGSVKDADELYDLAQGFQRAEADKAANVAELADKLDKAFAAAGGDICIELREAQSYAFEKVVLGRATGLRFADQLKAYNAAREIYKQEQRLRVFEEGLKGTRKYVVVADPKDKIIFIVDFQEKQMPDLYDIPGVEEISPK
ncbi:MAG: hypothetical protein JW720_12465 [Sedimentisphaerales bacterium]|nr:hypothetical protein [Sedimentisphaerales bacterium]